MAKKKIQKNQIIARVVGFLAMICMLYWGWKEIVLFPAASSLMLLVPWVGLASILIFSTYDSIYLKKSLRVVTHIYMIILVLYLILSYKFILLMMMGMPGKVLAIVCIYIVSMNINKCKSALRISMFIGFLIILFRYYILSNEITISSLAITFLYILAATMNDYAIAAQIDQETKVAKERKK